MQPLLGERLRSARRHLFVGRQAECQLFRDALQPGRLPFHVLYVWGPSGIGKTSLLHAFEDVCADEDVPCVRVSGSDLPGEPAALAQAIAAVVPASGSGLWSRLQSWAAGVPRAVLLLDDAEALRADGWLRTVLLPRLPQNVLLVLAGQHRRPEAWRQDPALASVVRALEVRNLSPEDGRHYLGLRHVPAEQHEAVVAFAHGHPLALSLVADLLAQRPGLTFCPTEAPEVIETLLRRFLVPALSAEQRAALAACAVVRYTTLPLLEALLDADEAYGLFEWLRTLSFIQARPAGLQPHELAREVLVADLRWRDEDAYRALHRRAREAYAARLADDASGAYESVLADYFFLYRDSPVLGSLFRRLQAQWLPGVAGEQRPSSLADLDALEAMVRAHEGPSSAELFRFWVEEQPGGLCLFRDAAGAPCGFLFSLALDQVDAAAAGADPAVRHALAHLEAEAPLRQRERAVLFRFWMDRDHYQGVSATQSLIFAETVRQYLRTPGLAYSFLPCAAPDGWMVPFAFADLKPLPAAAFELDGQSYGVYGHDWRVRPPRAWLSALAERGEAFFGSNPPPPPPRPAPVVLSRDDFGDALKEALKRWKRPDALAASPLLRARLVLDHPSAPDPKASASGEQQVAVLQQVVREAAEVLRAAPRDAKYARALERTYLDPAPTQEQAAEDLDLPFSTYRRHLRRGLDALTELLWRQETGY